MILNITMEDLDNELLKTLINQDMASEKKQFMRTCDNYMNVSNEEITNRRKMMVLLNDNDEPYLKNDYSKANHKLRHSYLQELINQCTNYLVGKPLKIDYKQAFDEKGGVVKVEKVNESVNPITGQATKSKSSRTDYSEQVEKDKDLIDEQLYLNNNFLSFLQSSVRDLQLYGTSFFRVVKLDDKLKFVSYNPKEIIMFYNDFGEPVLAIRYFNSSEIVTSRNGKKSIENVRYVEVFDKTTKMLWKEGNNGYEVVEERSPIYKTIHSYGDYVVSENVLELDVFPIIEWKFNETRTPTLANIKDFLDLQDLNLSDLANNVEDIQEAVWILENYNGQNLGEFLSDLKERKAVKVGAGGNARTETIEIPIEARLALYEACSKNIYKFGFGINFSERDSLGNVSGVALKWSYAPLEQKANSIETYAEQPLNDLFNIIFALLGLDYDSNELEFLFDRTMISNEQEQTSTIMSASSKLSNRTVLDNLPMVVDTEDELSRLEEENEYNAEIPQEDEEDGEEDTFPNELRDKPVSDNIPNEND